MLEVSQVRPKELTVPHRAVITGKDTPYKSVADLRGKTIGVSRMGSGSQIFASYMALREKWFSDAATQSVEPLDFKGNSSVVQLSVVSRQCMLIVLCLVLDTFKVGCVKRHPDFPIQLALCRDYETASTAGKLLHFCGSGKDRIISQKSTKC